MEAPLPAAHIEATVRFWWNTLPLLLRRLSHTLALAFVDGLYLAAYPMAGSLLPPLALTAGFLTGWLHVGFERVFSESLMVLVLLTVAGILSAHLGALLVTGYALGDFFLANTDWAYRGSLMANLFQIRLPLLIEYGLMALLVVTVPVLTKSLLAQLVPPPRLPRAVRFAFALLGHAVLTGALAYLWTQSTPLLIRPVYTWQGGTPPVSAMLLLQESSWVIVGVALLASITRMVLQGRAASMTPISTRMDELERPLATATPVPSLIGHLPPLGTSIAASLWATLMLSGMMESWLDAVLLGGLILAVQAARAGIIPVPLGPWARTMERIPVVVRLIGGLILLYFISVSVLSSQLAQLSFRPIVQLTSLGIVVLYLLIPGRTESRKRA
jgi:hypothetical protein